MNQRTRISGPTEALLCGTLLAASAIALAACSGPEQGGTEPLEPPTAAAPNATPVLGSTIVAGGGSAAPAMKMKRRGGRVESSKSWSESKSGANGDLAGLDVLAADDGGAPFDSFRFVDELAPSESAGRRLALQQEFEMDEELLAASEDAPTTATRARPTPEDLLAYLRPAEGETPEQYFQRQLMTRPFTLTALEAMSTFGLEADTASFTMARAQLGAGALPSPWSVRTEEFVNYLDSEIPAPQRGDFAVSTDLCPSPFGAQGSWIVRVGLRTRDVHALERGPVAITFVVDTSGSMDEPNRMPVVKRVLALLADQLDARDQIAVVSYSGEAAVLIPPTRGDALAAQIGRIEELAPEGSTNIDAGLALGCQVARDGFYEGAQNFVVLLSDGLGNVGDTQADALLAKTAEARAAGLHLNTVGVGMTARDAFLERLADAGNGRCDYVDDEREARRAFVERFSGAFQVVAKDAKLQVEFDAARVGRWRLLGYENRALAHTEFRDDAVDAGEIGAGHSVAALYELEDVVFQGDAPLGTVRLRYLLPSGGEAVEAAWPVALSGLYSDVGAAPRAMRAQILLAQFAELLAGSAHAADDDPLDLARRARSLAGNWGDETFADIAALMEGAQPLLLERAEHRHPLEDAARQLAFATYRDLLEVRRDPVSTAAASSRQEVTLLEAAFTSAAAAVLEPFETDSIPSSEAGFDSGTKVEERGR